MTRMIPATPVSGSPGSERRVFDLLKNDPGCEGWTVLHSVGLKRTGSSPYGEIDFVVFVPGKGIICLEVKGGEISCNQGTWTQRNRKTGKTKKLKKSPYMQARDGCFEIKSTIQSHFSRTDPQSGCPVVYAVVFPDVSAPPQVSEAEIWETFDIDTLRAPISGSISRSISASVKKLPYKPKAESVSTKSLAAIVKRLRPDFDLVVARSASIASSESQLIALTDNQYHYIDVANANPRAIVTGAAGTGKTLLAIQQARVSAPHNLRTVLLCYNLLLGTWLKNQLPSADFPNLDVDTFHSFLRKQISNSSFEEQFQAAAANSDGDRLFKELYPFFGELAVSENGHPYDQLIIDEAQDLIREENMPAFDAIAQGGLSKGRWTFFGDFNRQAIYQSSDKDQASATELIQKYSADFARVPLRLNCRNTRQIAEETALLSGFHELPYVLSTAEGLSVDYRYWKDRKEQTARLELVLNGLLNEKVPPEIIVVLSRYRFDKSVASTLNKKLRFPLVDVREIAGPAKDCIPFSTIHYFKGMESPAIVLCDIEDIESDEYLSLLYVGMSRARSHLALLLKESIRPRIVDLTKRKLESEWQT